MPEKLRIAYTTCFLDVSGVTKINFDILLRLKKKGHKVSVITTEGTGGWDYMFETHLDSPLDLSRMNKKVRFDNFIQFLTNNKVNIIYNTHSYWVYEHLPRIKKALPIVKVTDSLHVLEPFCFRGGYPDISANKYIHPLMDLSISISEDMKSYLLKNYDVDKDKITVIRNGIDTAKFKSSGKDKNSFKNDLGLEPDSKLIGFIGRLSEQKRPLMFLEIARQLLYLDNSCFFYIIGTGDLQNNVLKFINENNMRNRVFVFNQRGDIDHVLRSTDLLLAPSLYEGAPLTILEAISSYTPVISSNVGAIEEYIGNLCELIPRGKESEEIEKFVNKALSLSENKEKLLAASKNVREKFDISETAKEYEREFLRVLGA
jgi:glycosyltransferase involved in cell wall biosynthesis